MFEQAKMITWLLAPVVCSRDWRRMILSVTRRRDVVPCSPAVEHVWVHCRLSPTASVDGCRVTSSAGELKSLTVSLVWTCPTKTLTTRALCQRRLPTLAGHTRGWRQRHYNWDVRSQATMSPGRLKPLTLMSVSRLCVVALNLKIVEGLQQTI